ncbi:PREDICTED: uncharacterized protein LOC109377812 [Hipposideros armiger]|uniref:Uncharacterized protein LOC109377812 n=1 Tax=Hipposideros armiger TaxID=186990 RepID=A0A8B7QMI8_HIPAR|nr:PREDICTED: uncharacterized protein LOC109377812 [Hipposideros armiger]
MIRKALILSTWFVLAVTFPAVPPYADILNYLESQAELKPPAAPESTAALDLTDDVDTTTALDLTDDVDTTTALDLTDDVDTTTALDLTDDVDTTTALDLTDDVDTTTALDLAGNAESTTALDFIHDVESTTYIYLENMQTFELSTDVESNTPSFVEEATDEAMANVTGDYSEEPVTGGPENEADYPLAVTSTLLTTTFREDSELLNKPTIPL